MKNLWLQYDYIKTMFPKIAHFYKKTLKKGGNWAKMS